MSVTYRQMINRVLNVLTEDEVAASATSLDTQYLRLIGQFVNLIKEEVEDATNWRKLRHVESVTVLAGQTSVTIPNTNERSRLYREHNELAGNERPLVFDITDSNSPFPIEERDLATLLYQRTLDPGATNTYFVWFSIDDTAGDTVDLQVYPAPTTDRTISITMISPQERIANDTAGLDTEILVPARPVEYGAIWFGLEERGEELGVNAIFTEKKFRDALDDAIARDDAEQGGLNLVPV